MTTIAATQPETPAQFWRRFFETKIKTLELAHQAHDHYGWDKCACFGLKVSRRVHLMGLPAKMTSNPISLDLRAMGLTFSEVYIEEGRYGEAEALFDQIQDLVRVENAID